MQADRLHRRPAMKLHGVFEHVELMPARFWNQNVVRILAQRFIGIEAEEGLKLAVDMQNLEPRVIMIASGAAFRSCSRKLDGEAWSGPCPEACPDTFSGARWERSATISSSGSGSTRSMRKLPRPGTDESGAYASGN